MSFGGQLPSGRTNRRSKHMFFVYSFEGLTQQLHSGSAVCGTQKVYLK